MDSTQSTPEFKTDFSTLPPWSFLHRLGFRAFLIFFLLFSAIWRYIPWLGALWYSIKWEPSYWIQRRLGGSESIIYYTPTGSGDTINDWLQVGFYIACAVIGALLWSVLDRKPSEYVRLERVVRLFVRMFLASIFFSYGFAKLFALQMPAPQLAQLFTPLGSLSPMRLAWLYIGYSTPYEAFTGAMEILAGLLLLSRRTLVLGSILGMGVMGNVVMMNLCYDIPVKLYSALYFLLCVYVGWPELRQLGSMIFLRRTIEPDPILPMGWKKRTGWIATCAALIYLFGVQSVEQSIEYLAKYSSHDPKFYGGFEVTRFNEQLGRASRISDSAAWQNRWTQLVIGEGDKENGYHGFVRRGIYIHEALFSIYDSGISVIFDEGTPGKLFRITSSDSVRTELASEDIDSTRMTLKKMKLSFPLQEKPFHWISATPY